MRGIDSIAKPTMPRSASRSTPAGSLERREEADQHRARPDAVEILRRGSGDAGDRLDTGVELAATDDARTRVGVLVVREAGLGARSLLDDDLEALPEPADGVGDECDAPLAGSGLSRNGDLHPRANSTEPRAP